MKAHHILVTTIGVLAMSNADAGESISSTPPTNVIAEDSSGFTSELSVGYDSRLFYRGLWFGDNAVWSNLTVSKEVAPGLTWSSSALYADITDSDLAYSELDLGTSLAYETDYGTFTLGLLYYHFYDGFSGNNLSGPAGQRDAFEVNLAYSRELFWGINGSLLAAHDFRIDAQYFEGGLDKSWGLTDTISLETSVTVGYGLNDYYSAALAGDDADGFTHVALRAALPIQLAETVVLTPHVSANFSGDARKLANESVSRNDEVYFGVSLAVSF